MNVPAINIFLVDYIVLKRWIGVTCYPSADGSFDIIGAEVSYARQKLCRIL